MTAKSRKHLDGMIAKSQKHLDGMTANSQKHLDEMTAKSRKHLDGMTAKTLCQNIPSDFLKREYLRKRKIKFGWCGYLNLFNRNFT